MDVQAAAAVPALLPPAFAQLAPVTPSTSGPSNSGGPAVAPTVVPPPPVSNTDPGSNAGGSSSNTSNTSNSANSTIGATPGLATLPAGPPDGSKKGAEDAPLSTGVAKLFNAQEQNVSVSFQIEQNPNEIVTVFTDKQTGKVIVQFPSETLIALAKFFDKLDGSVVNKKV